MNDMNKVKVKFKHWKSGKELEVTGTIAEWVNEQSDRIVVEKETGEYEDILKNTIVSINNVNE